MLINKTRHKLENLMDDGYHLSNDDVFSVCDICGDSFEDIKKIPGKKMKAKLLFFQVHYLNLKIYIIYALVAVC